MAKVHEVTATFTVAFEFDDEDMENLDIKEYAAEQFLEYIGTVSDNWIMDGLDIEIVTREE